MRGQVVWENFGGVISSPQVPYAPIYKCGGRLSELGCKKPLASTFIIVADNFSCIIQCASGHCPPWRSGVRRSEGFGLVLQFILSRRKQIFWQTSSHKSSSGLWHWPSKWIWEAHYISFMHYFLLARSLILLGGFLWLFLLVWISYTG